MIVAGACYMLWLALCMLRPVAENGGERRSVLGFLPGLFLQFINPKLYIYGITAMSSYIMPHYDNIITLIVFAMIMAFVSFVSTICWAVFGAWLGALSKSRGRLINIVMAILLCYCAVSLFL
jgi:threonine/homoserine/homoserine lactone efflux protein